MSLELGLNGLTEKKFKQKKVLCAYEFKTKSNMNDIILSYWGDNLLAVNHS